MSPQDLEACVLAGLLNGGATPDAFDVIASTPEESFSIGFHRRAFSEIKKQALANGMIDMLSSARRWAVQAWPICQKFPASPPRYQT